MTNILSINKSNPIVEISNEALLAIAPSIGATSPDPKVSARYSFVSSLDAINLVRDAGWVPTTANEGRILKMERGGFQRHSVTFMKPELDMGDQRLGMRLYNSHDCGSSFILTGFIHRLVCSNGMVVGTNTAEFRHRHMNFSHDAFVESAKFVAEKMNDVGEVLLDWQKLQLDAQERMIFADAAHDTLNEGKAFVGTNPGQLLASRRSVDNSNDLWTVFNRIQENMIKGGIQSKSKKGRKTSTKMITNLHRDKYINQSLWNMAEHIADVKKAA